MSRTADADAATERDRVLAEVQLARAETVARGMKVMEQWAATGQLFSANEIRDALRAAGVNGPVRGAVFRAALTLKLIRKVRGEDVRSTDLGTHRKPIGRYVGVSASPAVREDIVQVPVRRDPAGRFSSSAQAPTEPTPVMFDLPGVQR